MGCICQILSCTSLLFSRLAQARLPHRALFRIKFDFIRSKSKFPTQSYFLGSCQVERGNDTVFSKKRSFHSTAFLQQRGTTIALTSILRIKAYLLVEALRLLLIAIIGFQGVQFFSSQFAQCFPGFLFHNQRIRLYRGPARCLFSPFVIGKLFTVNFNVFSI